MLQGGRGYVRVAANRLLDDCDSWQWRALEFQIAGRDAMTQKQEKEILHTHTHTENLFIRF